MHYSCVFSKLLHTIVLSTAILGFVISFSRLPLMVHRTNSGIPLSSSPSSSLSCPGSLRRGDIYTHCFHGHGGSIMDRETRRIDRSVVEKQVFK